MPTAKAMAIGTPASTAAPTTPGRTGSGSGCPVAPAGCRHRRQRRGSRRQRRRRERSPTRNTRNNLDDGDHDHHREKPHGTGAVGQALETRARHFDACHLVDVLDGGPTGPAARNASPHCHGGPPGHAADTGRRAGRSARSWRYPRPRLARQSLRSCRAKGTQPGRVRQYRDSGRRNTVTAIDTDQQDGFLHHHQRPRDQFQQRISRSTRSPSQSPQPGSAAPARAGVVMVLPIDQVNGPLISSSSAQPSGPIFLPFLL